MALGEARDAFRLDTNLAQLARRRDCRSAKIQTSLATRHAGEARITIRVEHAVCPRQHLSEIGAKTSREDHGIKRLGTRILKYRAFTGEPNNAAPLP
jgi:hypothetical protein